MLADLLAYQVSMHRERREALDRMAQEGQAAGLYGATVGPPIRTRLSSPMAMFPAFLDTCTLYGTYLCDSLLRLAEAGTYRPLWSADVLDELERVLVARGLPADAVKYRLGEKRRAFPDAEVRGYENIVETMTWDPKDRHVLAAAVRSDAAVLVTFNLDDFPDTSTAADGPEPSSLPGASEPGAWPGELAYSPGGWFRRSTKRASPALRILVRT